MKVLPKMIRTLELFSDGNELEFAAIVSRTGLTRSNQAHILRALCDNRLLEKTGFGRYRLGAKLFELVGGSRERSLLQMLAQRAADNIAGNLRELGVAVAFWRNQRITLAKARPERMVQLSIADRKFDRSGWYTLSSGRLLLALQSDSVILAVLQSVGLPVPSEWPEATDRENLFRQIRRIRAERRVVMRRDNGQLTSIAVPVRDAADADSLALSTVYITGSRQESDQAVVAELRRIAADTAAQLRFHHIAVRDLHGSPSVQPRRSGDPL